MVGDSDVGLVATTTSPRRVASPTQSPRNHAAAGPGGRPSCSSDLGIGEIHVVLTWAVDIGAMFDAEDGDEVYRVVDLVQDAEGPSSRGVDSGELVV